MTPERRAEIERLYTLAPVGSDEEAAYRELFVEIDRLKRMNRDIMDAVSQVKEIGGYETVYIISEADFKELQELRSAL